MFESIRNEVSINDQIFKDLYDIHELLKVIYFSINIHKFNSLQITDEKKMLIL